MNPRTPSIRRRVPLRSIASHLVAAALAFSALATPTLAQSPATFVRGDANSDDSVDISDAVHALLGLFGGGVSDWSCADAVDTNDDGGVDIADPIYSLGYLFRGGAKPPVPFPVAGVDPTPDSLGCGAEVPPIEIPQAPVSVRTSDWDIPEGACLSIPRYKVWVDPGNPARIWACFGSSAGNDTFRSMDAGKTWTAVGAQAWDYHVSMTGDSAGNLHFGSNDSKSGLAFYRKYDGTWRAPVYLDDYGGDVGTANVLAEGSNVWAFVRASHAGTHDLARIYYHLSTDGGDSFGPAVPIVRASDPVWKRIGSSMIAGEPALVLWEMDGSACNLRIFRWWGSSFGEIPGAALRTLSADPLTRDFGVTEAADGSIHFVGWDRVGGGAVLRHAQRPLAGPWSASVSIETTGVENGGLPTLTCVGSRVYCFYQHDDGSASGIRYRTWSEQAGWSAPRWIASGLPTGNSGHVSTMQRVPLAAGFVPVLWSTGNSPRTVYYWAVSASP